MICCHAGIRTPTKGTKNLCATITPHGSAKAPFIAVFSDAVVQCYSLFQARRPGDFFPLFIPFGTNLQLGRGLFFIY